MSQSVLDLDPGLGRIKALAVEKGKTFGGRPFVIGVAGASGSGKTTKVADKLYLELKREGAGIIRIDDYFQGNGFMDAIGCSGNFDDPRVTDLNLLVKHLKALKRGEVIRKPVYSFITGERSGYEDFPPAKIIIVEGLYALFGDVGDEVDLKVFVDISIHGSLLRRIMRDVKRTAQSEQEIFSQYVETVYPMFKRYIEPTRSRADIILVNHYNAEEETKTCAVRQIQLKAMLNALYFDADWLLLLGFEKTSVSSQEDTYYKAPNWGENYLTKELMRVRKENGKYFIAYKVPNDNGMVRVEQKIEFEVEPSMSRALLSLGYAELAQIKKRREIWVKGDLEVAVDSVNGRGLVLEIRSNDLKDGAAKIRQCIKDWGIPVLSTTAKSYLEILLNKK